MVVPGCVPPLGLAQLRRDDAPNFCEDSFSAPALAPIDARHEEMLMTPALRGWLESVVDARVEQVCGDKSWMALEGKLQRLEDDLRSLAQSQDELVRIVDGLTGDAERQNVSTNKVRQEALFGVQQVISTVDDLQRAVGQDGEGVFAQLRRVTAEMEEFKARHAEEAERFRTEMSDLRRLQTEASLQHRDCVDQLNSLSDLRKDLQSSTTQDWSQDEVYKVEQRITALEKHLVTSAAKQQREQQELLDAEDRTQEACGRLRGEHESHERRVANVEHRVLQIERQRTELSDVQEQVKDMRDHHRSWTEVRSKDAGEAKQLLATIGEEVKTERDARERQHASQERRLQDLEETFRSRARGFGTQEELTDTKQLLASFGEEVQSERETRERQFVSLERRLRDFEATFNSRAREFGSREAISRLGSELQSVDAKFQELTDSKQLVASFEEQVQQERDARERQFTTLERRLRDLADALDNQTREYASREAISRLDIELQKVDAKVQEHSTQLKRVRELDEIHEQLRQAAPWKGWVEESSLDRRRLQDQMQELRNMSGARHEQREEEAAKLDLRLRKFESAGITADERSDRLAAELERRLAAMEADVGEAMRELSSALDAKELHSKTSALRLELQQHAVATEQKFRTAEADVSEAISELSSALDIKELLSKVTGLQRDLQQHFAATEQQFRKVEDRFGMTASADALEAFLQKLHRELDADQYIRSSSDCKRSQEFREELREEFRRLAESCDAGVQRELADLEKDFIPTLISETTRSKRPRAILPTDLPKRGLDAANGTHQTRRQEVRDDESITTEVTPETADRMSKELDLFVGLHPADAARIFVHRASNGLRA